ncbi:hypothetical protein ACQHMG_25070, partial [Escherichia coli]|uniref:hypothetical protein n=2 Tax=Pseudomonadota TaxID=1224 RepID=UPI003CF3FE72
LDAPYDRETAERVVVEGADRDSWFIGYAVSCGLIEDEEVDAVAATDIARVAALARNFDPDRPRKPDPEPGNGASSGAGPG